MNLTEQTKVIGKGNTKRGLPCRFIVAEVKRDDVYASGWWATNTYWAYPVAPFSEWTYRHHVDATTAGMYNVWSSTKVDADMGGTVPNLQTLFPTVIPMELAPVKVGGQDAYVKVGDNYCQPFEHANGDVSAYNVDYLKVANEIAAHDIGLDESTVRLCADGKSKPGILVARIKVIGSYQDANDRQRAEQACHDVIIGLVMPVRLG